MQQEKADPRLQQAIEKSQEHLTNALKKGHSFYLRQTDQFELCVVADTTTRILIMHEFENETWNFMSRHHPHTLRRFSHGLISFTVASIIRFQNGTVGIQRSLQNELFDPATGKKEILNDGVDEIGAPGVIFQREAKTFVLPDVHRPLIQSIWGDLKSPLNNGSVVPITQFDLPIDFLLAKRFPSLP